MTELGPAPAAADGDRTGRPRDAAATSAVPLAQVTRGGQVESRHRGAVCVAFADGRTWSVGPVDAPVWARSVVKPFQALPFVERGLVDRHGLSAAELAVLSASHDGTPAHVDLVRALHARTGLTGDDLQCGPHAPFDKASSFAIARAGGKPERVHNNCSGKHTGFLLLARELGEPLDRYLDPSGATQTVVRRAVADLTELDADAIDVAVDGCGAPTLRLPLVALARGFARLIAAGTDRGGSGNGANPASALNLARLPDVRRRACATLLAAITTAPEALAGEKRLCTTLVRAAPGRIYPKNGAEGLYACGALTPFGPVGVTVKVEDGAERGYFPVVVELLARLGLWGEVPEPLQRFARVPILNTQKRVVGDVTSVLSLPGSWPRAW